MAGGNFLHRVISYVVNEVVVNGLANRLLRHRYDRYSSRYSRYTCESQSHRKSGRNGWCPAFQRFAVRTSKRIEDLSIKAAQTKQELTEQVKDLSRNFEDFKKQ
ncbi:hypothetical protein HYC85_022146 [Camellia sinensis]|uniref:Uncharacterized protein n=1 Tax=Camellia sinensis TaxID=4442 RepID=A0A7J7GJJ3_CAMSI|nr:hypothetical protein HYC85_022146 [Camellia sinensis]